MILLKIRGKTNTVTTYIRGGNTHDIFFINLILKKLSIILYYSTRSFKLCIMRYENLITPGRVGFFQGFNFSKIVFSDFHPSNFEKYLHVVAVLYELF